MTNNLRTTSAWLTDLANLTAGRAMMDEIKPRIGAMAAALAAEFPEPAFCHASLLHVARKCKFFPSYAELVDTLGPWWKEHRPTPPQIASDQPATIRQREIERDARESWENVTAEQVNAKIRAIRADSGALTQTLGSFLAAALAKHAPRHLGLLPPAWIKAHVEPPHVTAMRQPNVMTIHRFANDAAAE